jgi:hypothetical protein
MLKRSHCVTLGLGLCVLLAAPLTRTQSTEKKKVTSEADLPRFSYPVKGTASALVQADNATFNAFASKVRADLDGVLRDYEIEDKSTLGTLLSAKANLEEIAGENQAALETLKRLRAVQEKPAAKLTTGIFAMARLEAAIETKSTQGAAYEEAFKKNYSAAVDPLPWDVVQDTMKESYTSARLFQKPMAVGYVMTELDPAVEKSGALDNNEAWDLVGTRDYLEFAPPLSAAQAYVLKEYIAKHNVAKPDIWAARDVTLTSSEKLTPVLVGIWDSGVDVSVYPKQLFTDPHPTASGTHGLAFDDKGGVSKEWLYPLTPEQQKTYPELRDEIK